MSTQIEVDRSYSVDTDFFRLWLDAEMNYTCALFEDTTGWSDTLERAQRHKLAFLSRLARIGPGTTSVLDIGCGWGANVRHQAVVNGVSRVQGITLSRGQYEYCQARTAPGVTVDLADYRDFTPGSRFDAVMCICMMEHIARPEDARSGRHLDLYRDFFRRVHAWSADGAWFALQAITTHQLPRSRQDLEDMRHANEVIFPGGSCPRVEDLVMAASPYFELMEIHARRQHYRRTAACWLDRLRASREEIVDRWGPVLFLDYERYLAFCCRAFERSYQSLHQFAFRRRQEDEW
jgi:cyclopropane-fatty-acyl-phospholipid synthase